MIKKFKIKEYNLTFVLRHRFEKDDDGKQLDKYTIWNKWKLGLWFKKNRIVGVKNFNKPKQWSKNLVNGYMLGVSLLIIEA